MSKVEPYQNCPICDQVFDVSAIENHVNKCIFLNSFDEPESDKAKRKRSPSPSLLVETPKSKLKSSALDSLANPGQSQGFKKPTTPIKTIGGSNQNNNEDPLSFTVPLAKQMQPKSLNDFFGQNHILGKDTVLRQLLSKGDVPDMILWGPPGCGKTSLSNVISELCKSNPNQYKFVALCAADCGIKEVQNVVAKAKMEKRFGRKTILFMDEIHRFNKRQQDTFLLHVEKGHITLVGATTENPSFCINSALLSRCRVIVMEKLTPEAVYLILENACNRLKTDVIDSKNEKQNCKNINSLSIEKAALIWLADTCDGDARIALSNLQLVLQHSLGNLNRKGAINIEDIKQGIKKSHLLYDRKGEEHYNIISAMHKSIRGSDPNAALYWTTRMIVSGEDPLFIARRMVRAASEDIGNADPNALQLAISTMQGCQLIGMPEADVLLAQCAIYLARAPKSREADSALAAAKSVIKEREGLQPSVPMHLRNAPTKLMQDLGYGKLSKGSSMSYMPEGLENVDFFQKRNHKMK